jgi:hypothetical protein
MALPSQSIGDPEGRERYGDHVSKNNGIDNLDIIQYFSTYSDGFDKRRASGYYRALN